MLVMHRTVILWLLAIVGLYAFWLIVSAARVGTLVRHYRRHFSERRRERIFLASLSFFLTFAVVRLLTHAIRAGRGPFHNMSLGGRHIHHLVWGISLLLVVGYGWLVQVGTGMSGASVWMGRVMALLYGVGAALTLDEFALWLNLADVYWSREGRESIDVVLLFGSLLSAGVWGGPFLRTLTREAVRIMAPVRKVRRRTAQKAV
jgi:hypothetical protein